jgi:glycosyltransferase involved in cell wall biosynthesis
MRILTILPDLGPGGTQRVAQNFAAGYQHAGHPSAVLAYRSGGDRAEPLRLLGLPVFAAGVDSIDHSIALAAAWKPDILHVHRTGDAHPLSIRIIKQLRSLCAYRLPCVETNVFGKPDYSPDGDAINIHFQISEWSFWKWSQWTRSIHRRPIGVLIPYLVDESAFYPASDAERRGFRDAYGIPSDAMLFGRVGQPLEPKWSSVILKAFSDVARHSETAWLLLIGAPSNILAKRDTLPPAIIRRIVSIPFIHGDAGLRSAYGAIDVFLHASQIGESFGMVLAESLLCGTPIISLATSLRDNSQMEIVGHERGGLLVRDLAGMIQAMELLTNDTELRRTLAAKGAAHIRTHFSSQVVVADALRLFGLLLQLRDRELLRKALGEAGFVIQIPDARIRSLYQSALGKAPFLEWPAIRLVHSPTFYRLRQAYRLHKSRN